MELKWHAEAKLEAGVAAAFYKEKRPGLEQRFLDSLDDTLRRIRRYPKAHRRIEEELRKCRVPHFPYGVVYRIRSNRIEIIAIMHLRRLPGYWKQRT